MKYYRTYKRAMILRLQIVSFFNIDESFLDAYLQNQVFHDHDIAVGPRRLVGSVSYCRSRDHVFKPQPRHITFVEIDYNISSIILPLSLIQEGQLSVSGECIPVHEVLVNLFGLGLVIIYKTIACLVIIGLFSKYNKNVNISD